MTHRHPFFLPHHRPGQAALSPLSPGGTPGVLRTGPGPAVWPLSRRLRPSERRSGPITPARPCSAADGRPTPRDAIANAARLVLFTVAATGYACCAGAAAGTLVFR